MTGLVSVVGYDKYGIIRREFSNRTDLSEFGVGGTPVEGGTRQVLELRVGDERLRVGERRPLVILGRSPASDLVVEDEYTSRSHARLEYRDGRYYLRDESRNGTYILWLERDETTYLRCAEVELSGSGRLSLGRRFEDNSDSVIEFSLLEVGDGGSEEKTGSGSVVTRAVGSEAFVQEPTTIVASRASVRVRRPLLEPYLAYRLFEEYTDRILVLLDKEGFILYYNYYLERLTRRKYADFVGQDFFSFVHPEDRQNLLDILTQIGLGIFDNLQVKLRICTAEPRWQAYSFRIASTTPSLQTLNLDGIVLMSMDEGSSYFRDNLLAGRYRIIKGLRTTNFCETYLGEDLHRPSIPRCIIKKLHLNYSDEPKVIEVSRRLFYQEALTLENLGHHDRIPLLLAYFEDHEYFYLIQDFIEGQSLDNLLNNPWSVLETVNLLRQVLSILYYVHGQDVIHRDVKPANIIRRKFDNNYVLIDFGSVKLLPSSIWSQVGGSKQRSLTVVVGTPGYMAPEQALGKPTKASDIYSLGVVAIEALLGQSYQHVRQTWVSELEALNVDMDLIRILRRMVAVDLSERYQDVQQILLELSYLSLMDVDINKEI